MTIENASLAGRDRSFIGDTLDTSYTFLPDHGCAVR